MTDADESPERTALDPGTWVVGVDGSSCARNALVWAAANAPGRAAKLQLISAWQVPVVGAYPAAGSVVLPFDDSEFREAAGAEVEELAGQIGGDLSIPVEGCVAHGNSAAVLLEASSNGSLLVIGSRGRGGFARLLLGSTSTQCATHATVPTVIVRNDATAAATERILVGFDGSPNSMAALRWAVDFAAPGTTVTAAWVWDATPLAVGADAFFFPDASDLAAERFHHLAEAVVADAAAAEVVLEQIFIRGTPRSALSDAARDADLLVVGARGYGAVGAALLGSVSTWLLHHVHIPIAVVPLADEADEDEEPPADGPPDS